MVPRSGRRLAAAMAAGMMADGRQRPRPRSPVIENTPVHLLQVALRDGLIGLSLLIGVS